MRPTRRKVAVLITVGVVAIGVTLFAVERTRTWMIQAALDIAFYAAKAFPYKLERELSIAVLPFVNMSSDKENTYFSDGISEEILNALVQTNRMPVIARTSSFQFKGSNLDLMQIGSALNVTHILEGSVRKSDRRVRITAQVNDAITGVQLWSNTYDGDLRDVLGVQREIATSIVNELHSLLKLQASQDVTTTQISVKESNPLNLDAYDSYMKGIHHFRKASPIDNKIALESFVQATEIDPSFADAWVYVARTYAQQCSPLLTGASPVLTLAKAHSALTKARDLDPEHPWIDMLLAMKTTFIDYQWREGLGLMKSVVDENPFDAELQMVYATLQTEMGDFESGVATLERAYQLDPLNPGTSFALSTVYFQQGRQLDGLRLLGSVVERGDFSYMSHLLLWGMNQALGRTETAAEHFEAAKNVAGSSHPALLFLEGQILSEQDEEAGQEILRELYKRQEEEGFLLPVILTGERDPVDELRQAYQQRHLLLPGLMRRGRPDEIPETEWQRIYSAMNLSQLDPLDRYRHMKRTADEISDLLEREIHLRTTVLDRFKGTYKGDGLVTLEFSRQDDYLWLKAESGYGGMLIPITESHFQLLDYRFEYEFTGSDGTMLERLGDIEWDYARADE
jgi:TolB-like protein/tetratricopeptide (TPR) repeat protein